VTVYTAMYLNLQVISFIDNREYPGIPQGPAPGPEGYQHFIYNTAISYVPHIMFLFNTWLVDGLLLYRCYVIYAKNYWVIGFPFLMYIASFAMGIVLIYFQITQPTTRRPSPLAMRFNYPFFTISPSVNIILTLMIVGRLVVHRRNLQSAMGSSARTTSGLYKAVVTILVESCALYAASFILFLVPWGLQHPITNMFFPIVAQTQVIAPLLIIHRAATQKALTSETVVSRVVDSLRYKSAMDSTSQSHDKKATSQISSGMEATIELHRYGSDSHV